MLVLRLSPVSLTLARQEDGRIFEHATLQLHPNSSLVELLREAVAAQPVCKPLPSEGVVVSVVGNFTPVPLADFQEEYCDTFYNYSVSPDVKHRAFYDVVPAANMALLFGLPELTCQMIEEVFGEVRYVSAITSVVKHMYRRTSGASMFIYAYEQDATIMLMESGKLALLNTYSVQNADDVAYYALSVLTQFGIKPDMLTLSIAGHASVRNPMIARLQQFVPKVLPVLPTQEFNHEIAAEEALAYDLVTLLLSKSR